MSVPVVLQYQQALDAFRREGREPPLLKRMSELISLLDLTTTLGSSLGGGAILEAALLVVMGELQVSRGALYVHEGAEGFRLRVCRGGARGLPPTVPAGAGEPLVSGAGLPGFELACPIRRGERTIALLVLGPRASGAPFGPEERGFIESLAACAAVPIENGLVYEELRQANRSLSVKVYQLNNLFDIFRELTAQLEEEAIERLVATTAMGQFLATRSAVYRVREGGLDLVHARGCRAGGPSARIEADGGRLLQEVPRPRAAEALPPGPLREALLDGGFALAVPLAAGERVSGLLAVGPRPGGRPFSDEDLDFAAALARQTQAALEGARAQRLRLEKERQDRDLQIAREIQQTLFPREAPALPGFELAALSRSCFQVGGDYYDFIPLEQGRLGLVVADVSGKGTPASLMMASVHAWLRATAGTAPPARVLERLNRFLYASTQTSRYVTLFYAELDPARRVLAYVNAGHVPPYAVKAGGGEARLTAGGPVLGLLEEVSLEAREIALQPGDLVAVVTDGATEAQDPSGEELGDERVRAALRSAGDEGAPAALASLVRAVDAWTGAAGCTDDLTALILRAT